MVRSRRVVVTGLAYVTGLGFGDDDHEPALRASRGAAGLITRFDTEGFRTRVGAQCDDRRLDGLLEARWPSARLRRLGIETRMLLWTAAEALADAGLERARLDRPLTCSLGTTLEGFWQGEQWYEQYFRRGPEKAPPHLVSTASAGAQLALVAELLECPLEPHVVSNACATGISAIGRLFRRIRLGSVEVGLAGGYDCLSRFIQLGFNSLGALTAKPCAPFDRNRSGFFIGDGAAALVLESLDSARRRGARIRGEIVGYGETVDAYHSTHPDPEGKGVARAIRRCLEEASVAPGEIGYVNAHGTATPANDAAEAKGLLAALGEDVGRRVPVSSTKALVGHTLGAAGAVEQCFCFLAMNRGFLPPQANLVDPDPACPLNLIRRPEGRPRVAMNNAFGFGGANGVLLSRRWEDGA